MIPVLWLSLHKETPCRGYWDQAMLESIFSMDLWKPVDAFEFRHIEDYSNLNGDKGAVVVIPARYHAEDAGYINKILSPLEWCVVILTGDEEAVFPVDELKHPRMKIWAMTPHPGKYKNIDRYLINGWSNGTREYLKMADDEAFERPLKYFFAGQVTHKRRRECVKGMDGLEGGEVYESPGFTQGISRELYFKKMASSKVAPCPSGAVIPDTFRTWEALEAGSLPIVDKKTSHYKYNNYWEFLLGEVPFPQLDDWSDLAGNIAYFYDTFPQRQNKVFAWWQAYKRQMAYNLQEDIKYLSKMETTISTVDDQITVLIPTSPISAHPDTSMIEETIKSVRSYLPNAEIIIMFDGIREEQKERGANYEEYKRRLLWKINTHYHNVLPLMFGEHLHQVAMTREALKHVKTGTILFAEHDTPLCEFIPFPSLIQTVNEGTANMIRLHHEALILPIHKNLMLSDAPQIINSIPLMPTAQWSQRPHIANTNFYRMILDKYFTPGARVMIEDGIHGKLAEDFRLQGKVGWNNWKVFIYAPEGDMKRSYNLDGRKSDPKFDNLFIY